MSDIGEIRLGPLNSQSDLVVAAQELADKENELVRELLALATKQVHWDDIEGKPVEEAQPLSPVLWVNIEDIPSTLEGFQLLQEVLRHIAQEIESHNIDEEAHPELVRDSDSRLTDARTPVAHTHSGDDIDGGSVNVANVNTGALSATGFVEISELQVNGASSLNTIDAQSINVVAVIGSPITASVGSATCTNLDADRLDAQEGSFYLDRANHSGTQDVATISGVMIRAQLPTPIAYEDEVNTYTARQRIIANSAVSTLLDLLLIAGSSNSVVGGGYPSIMVVNRNLVGPSLSRFTFNVGDGTLLGSFLADLNAQGTGTDFYSAGFDERAMGISIYSAHPFIVKTGNVTRLKVPGTAPAADQAALLLQVNAGGITSVRQVTVGAVDSGGAGFRLLRVPN